MAVTPWITVDDLDDPDHEDAEIAVQAASWVLWELSGRKYGGVRTIVETYCQLAAGDSLRGLPIPILMDGRFYNFPTGGCRKCGCSHVVKLRATPVIEIEGVRYRGTQIPFKDISVYDYSYLGLSELGSGCWGTCDDITVTYTYGAPPPPMGVMAAKELANQFIWSLTDDDRCALPQRVTSITRQNFTMTLLDPQDFLEEGRTGLYQVDLFLRVANPTGSRRRARVFSPDLRHGRSRR